MERKYIMQLPRGAKVSSTDIKYEDGKIVLTAQLEEWKPEDGEICYVRDISGYESIFIKRGDYYNTASYYVSFDNNTTLYVNSGFVVDNKEIDVLRPATEEERKKLFDAMAKEGKRWNAEKKVMEDVRWRAKAEGYYYRIDGLIGGTPDVSVRQDFRSPRSNTDYEIGNYFKTKQAAVIACNQVADVIKNSKAE